jgi:hypothetical protein
MQKPSHKTWHVIMTHSVCACVSAKLGTWVNVLMMEREKGMNGLKERLRGDE